MEAPSMEREASIKQSHAKDCSVPHPEQPLTPGAQSTGFGASTSPLCLVKEARGEEEEEHKEDYDDYIDYDYDDDDDDKDDDFVVITKETHLKPSDNYPPKLDQNQDLETCPPSRVSNPKERQSDITESSTDRTSNDFEEDVQLFENREEINSEIPELAKEKQLGPSDNHYANLDQNWDLETGPSSRVSSPTERQSDITESSTDRTSNDFEEDVQLFENREEINSEIPELAKEKQLGPSDNHHANLDQNQDLETCPPSRVSNPKERQSDITESSTDRTSNDFEEDVQLFENREEINSEIPELAKQKQLGPSDNHHANLDQNRDLEAGPSSRVSSPTERQSDITESSTDRTSNDFEEDVQLFENREEINSEIPELAKEKQLGPSDNHHANLDQNQDLETCPPSRVSNPKERQSDITESSTDRTSNDFEEDVQLFENREEINSEIPELAKQKQLGPSDNHHANLDQNRDLEAGPSSQVSSSRERLSNSHISEYTRPVIQGQRQYNVNGEQRISFGKKGYVDGKWERNRLIKLYSCEFTHPHTNQTIYIRNQRPGYLFTFDEDDFIARVMFNKLGEVDFVRLPVVKVRENLLKKLIIIDVIRDKETICRDAVYMQFIQLLQDRSGKTVENLECAEDIFQLSIILQDYRLSPRGSILDNIVNNTYISSDFKDACRELINREKTLDARRKDFPHVYQFQSKNVFAQLYTICESAVKNHKTSLLEKCFSSTFELSYAMDSNINALSAQKVFYISNQDINLFCDLANEMNESFSIFLSNLQNLLFNKVMKVKKHISLKELAPLTHPIYFHLCKHIQDLILEISGKTDMSVNDLLKIDDNGEMVLVNCINWPVSPLNHSLEKQYRFVFKLMRHFEPVYSTKQKFKYRFKLPKRRGNKSYWSSIRGCFINDKVPDIPEVRLVWMYVLDNSIAELFPTGSEESLELFQPLLEGYTRFIQETEDVNYESSRIVMYNIARFIAQALPYLSEGASEMDRVTLTNQIASIQYAISNKQFIDFRDLVDVYNEYWKNRESLVDKIPDKFPYGKFKGDMETIRQQLYSIVNTVLSKGVNPQALINYFRSFNEFLEDLNAVEFGWIIKNSSDVKLAKEEVELVNTDKKSYKVLDPENFINKPRDIPRHYLIEIIYDLLNSVSNLLLGQNEWSSYDNINAASELVLAIKKSLLYLKEQPNYVSFDTFKEESTQPFACVVEDSSSYEDFIKRVSIVGESFWYLRKQDEIDIRTALMLYRRENKNMTTEIEDILIDCYHKYLDKFNSYIQLTCNKNYADKIEFITKEVKDQVQLIDYDEWRENFKRETLPEILAGLAAVWSIEVSKDIVSARKTLKPHCIQVLCILLLLSVDKSSKGVQKRFAQVLTGQGKSLIIGLTATLFALMGYRIQAACYSKYLAIRDQEDFDNIFKLFGVKHKVTYGTFEDMVWELLTPMVNDTSERTCLGKLLADRILNHGAEQFGQLNYGDRSKTILFIDEVDVFFSPMFYGKCHSTVKLIGIPALVGIQEYIWELACKNCERSIILNDVEELINKRIRERNNDFIEFKKFLIKPGHYYLLKHESDHVHVKQLYTNQYLYEEHRNSMIDDAIRVAKASDTDSVRTKFKIDDYGKITFKDKYGMYSPDVISGYHNVFNYFRLKKRNYSHEKFCNYGYLRIDSGTISFAKLPNEYPLILGVSGTLTELNNHEKNAVRNSYSIHENSIMPSYFGESNLQFNISNDFVCETSEEQWLSKIDSHANSKIASGRSILIFFDTDIEIDKFKNKFCSKYNRLHMLDANTKKQIKQKYINEAGITKTVTLATREMGRGVDFKSSVAVEKKGGLHVIQTFLSLDIKEEMQIKGRTARKDNKGSYELIVCKIHLTNAGLLDTEETDVSYERLSESRKKVMESISSVNEKNIEIRDDQHKLTMEFFESFFKKNCSINIEQPSENVEGEELLGFTRPNP
ncbi:uncharacterized protein LOC143217985 [Lasioglossum baleicum]|uniref:uncharacterized protein LOC143217985 n=1 Tax=Lasioglossum baleicum TaxID=434251 RepID=UPI003FCDC9B7